MAAPDRHELAAELAAAFQIALGVLARLPILPRRRYEPPPSQDRKLPFAMDTWDHLTTLAARRPQGKLAELLGSELAGFSRQVAREVAFRATGSIDTPVSDVDWSTVLETVVTVLGE